MKDADNNKWGWVQKKLSCCIKIEKNWFHLYCCVGSFLIVADKHEKQAAIITKYLTTICHRVQT